MAVQQIRRMRGGAQGHLMLGSDGKLWVVKFQNNPQHVRVLANEMLATRLAAAVGLTVPETAVVEVSRWLIAHTPELEVDWGAGVGAGSGKTRCAAGLQFGARYMGGVLTGNAETGNAGAGNAGPAQVVDYLPEELLGEIRNLEEFAGMLALDKWTGNVNGRQAVFLRKARERRYRACFIDQGYCFHAGEWRFEDAPLRGVHPRNAVYAHIAGWESFEPWLTRLETIDPGVVWRAAEGIPPEWYGQDGKPGDMAELEALVETLLRRRGKIRELIEEFGRSDRRPFPKWVEMGRKLAG